VPRAVAGGAALAAALAWLAWAVVSMRTHGTAPVWLLTPLHALWTLLPVPAFLVLARELTPLAPARVWAAAAAGVLSLLLWTAAYVLGWWPAGLEVFFIGLSALSYFGLAGPLRRAGKARLGWMTLALGVAAAADAFVTGAERALPGWMFPVLGGAKLPLQAVWTAVVGIALLRRGRAAAEPDAADTAARAA
jgi:hypothetical protein